MQSLRLRIFVSFHKHFQFTDGVYNLESLGGTGVRRFINFRRGLHLYMFMLVEPSTEQQ